MHLFTRAAATDGLGYHTPGLVWTLWQLEGGTESLSSQNLPSCRKTGARAQEMCVGRRRWWKGLWRETGGWCGCCTRSVIPQKDPLPGSPCLIPLLPSLPGIIPARLFHLQPRLSVCPRESGRCLHSPRGCIMCR